MEVLLLQTLSAVQVLNLVHDTKNVIKEYLKRNPDFFNSLLYDNEHMTLKESVLHAISVANYKSGNHNMWFFLYEIVLREVKNFSKSNWTVKRVSEIFVNEKRFCMGHAMRIGTKFFQMPPMPIEDNVIDSPSAFMRICWPYASRVIDILLEENLTTNILQTNKIAFH